MSDLGFNKIAAAALVTGLGLIGLNTMGESFFHHDEPETPGFLVEVEGAADDGHGAVEEWIPPTDYGVLLASADIAAGQKKAGACTTCHSFDQGGAVLQGPVLWDVVGRAKGAESYGYSAAMMEMGGDWDYAALDGFLKSPKKYMKGTAMNYAGLSKEKDRMNVIAYLRSLSEAPAALPAPLPAEALIPPSEREGHGAEVVDAAHDVVEDAAHTAGEAVDGVVEAAGEAVEATGDAVEGVVDAAVEDATTEATDVVDGVVADVTDAVEETVEDVDAAAEDHGDDGH